MKQRFGRNKFAGLNTQSRRKEQLEDVRMKVKCHFEESDKEPIRRISLLDGVEFQILHGEDKHSIELPFSEEEVKEVVWCNAKDKSPGPDGFTLIFSKIIGKSLNWTF